MSFKQLSIRIRLTLWYSLLFAFVQIAIGLAAWGILHHSLSRVVRETLQNRVEGVRRFLSTQKPDLEVSALRAETTEEYEHEQDGDWLQIRYPGGEWLYRSSLMTLNHVSHLDDLSSDSDVLTGRGRLQGIMIGEKRFAFLTERIQANGKWYDVEAGLDVSDLHDMFSHFKIGLLLLAPLAVLLAAVGGYWLSGRALRPVDAITQAARSIGAENLGQRLASPQTGDELQRLSETLNGMLERIELGFRHITEFTADASHELRTPLALIRTEAELILRKPRTSAEYETGLRNILAECNRTAAMVDGLLSLARADAGVDNLVKAPLALPPLFKAMAKEWDSSICQRGLQFTTSVSANDLYVNADATALRRAITILLDNACRYTPAPGKIELSLEANGQQAMISVRDTGIGIAPEDQPRIFERFYRADKARNREQGGVGLGLAIAESIVRKHDGEIQVTSQPGEGSTFRMILPTVPAPALVSQ